MVIGNFEFGVRLEVAPRIGPIGGVVIGILVTLNSVFDIRCSIFDIRCSIFDILFDTQYANRPLNKLFMEV